MKTERIFIQIASYRDTQCQHTVRDAFLKAKYPERIFVGICWQVDALEDTNCFYVPYPIPGNVREVHYDYRESKGGVWARTEAQKLAQDEEYTLAIDSHMRFVEGWDELLITMLRACPTHKAVLSTCLPGYTPPHYLQDCEGKTPFMHVKSLGKSGETQLIHHNGGLRTDTYTTPFPTPFVILNFLFTRTSTFHEVPYDPHIYFHGGEISYAARLWTHGYLVYQPHLLTLYHQWNHRNTLPRPYRTNKNEQNRRGAMRVRHLLGLEQAIDKDVLTDIEYYGLGTARALSSFWEFAGIDLVAGTIEEFATKGRWQHHQETHDAMSNNKNDSARIFVQIASYRDTECQWTVKDLFEKAAHPERVFVGICWQYDPDTDANCFEVEPPLPDNVRINPYHWQESKGVCWARHEAQKLYEGEEYVLMIDSHMRFVPGWDRLLIEELRKCDSWKPLISCHPASYTPPNTLEQNPKPTIMRTHMFDDKGDIRCKGEFLDREPPMPLNGAFIAAGFVFTLGSSIKEVPYDPYIYFNQEEILLAARFYTHGWDVFSATKQYLYHYYNSGKAIEKRPTHWADHKDWGNLQTNSRKRFNHLLGITPTTDAEALVDIEQFGMGTTRSLTDFEAYAGIDFKTHSAGERALRCLFIKDLMKYKDRPVYIPELDAPKMPEAPVATSAPVASVAPAAAPASAVSLSMQQVATPASAVITGAATPAKPNRQRTDVPPGVLVIEDFVDESTCKILRDYADQQVGIKLKVLDNENSTKDKIATKESSGRITDHVSIDNMPGEILSVFNHIYTRVLEPFYNVKFEWYERPQILRYSAGGKYNQHADSEHWIKEKNEWIRSQDRDYSVLLYLNEDYGGGELEFTSFKYSIKPKTGMLIGFPSDHRYLHAALPTLSGMRYVIVSWAAILGSPRIRDKAPYASVYLRNRATMV